MTPATRSAVRVGGAGGVAFSAWSIATSFWPVPYRVWDLGRAAIFLAFVAGLTALARSVARSGLSLRQTFAVVAMAMLLAAGLTLAAYAVSTGLFARQIAQLPDFALDYAHHGYNSPAAYLADNYVALLLLQIVSWAIGSAAMIMVAGAVGWPLRRIPRTRP